MTQAVFIARGTGYDDDRTQDGYTVLAEPLADRESRVLGREPDGRGGVCYRAYSLKLAKRDGERGRASGFYLLIQHGGGSEVLHVGGAYDNGEMLAAILAMPEAAQYALLWSIYQTARDARETATAETAMRYGHAFLEGRMRKRRKGGFVRVEVEAAWLALVDGKPVGRFVGKGAMDAAMNAATAAANAKGGDAKPTAQSTYEPAA